MNAPSAAAGTIPRRIIQTGKSSDLPLKEKAAVANLRLLNPDFEYLFFDDRAVEKFFDEHGARYRCTIDAFPQRIQRYDFFRYLAVHHFGGFYFDLDVFLAKPLDELLAAACVFPFEGLSLSTYLRRRHGMDWHLGNYAFGACRGHPLLGAVIENCVKAMSDPAWVRPMMQGLPPLSRKEFLVLNTSGPGLLSRTFAENPQLVADVRILFQEDVCDVQSWNRFGDFGVHLMDGSWRQRRGFLHRRIAQYWEVWQMESLLRESRRLGRTRSTALGPRSAGSSA